MFEEVSYNDSTPVVGSYWKCEHKRQEKRKRVLKNGIANVVLQCLDCGSHVRTLPKAGEVVSILPEFDEDIGKRWQTRVSQLYEQRRKDQSAQFWSDYNLYLQSNHWRNVRQIVLTRDRLCQVCFRQPSAQAHHLSYESFTRYGFSFAVECVGVCYNCHHEILHKDGRHGELG